MSGRRADPTVHDDEPTSALFANDMDVLAMLPSGSRRDGGPVLFGSPRWDLSAVKTWPAYAPPHGLVWAGIKDPKFRVTAKETAVLLMCPQIAIQHHVARARRTPYRPWELTYQRMSYWRRWFNYLTREGFTGLSSVDQGTCEAFLTTITPDSRHIAISAMREFEVYGELLSLDRYSPDFRPWGTLSAAAGSGQPGLGRAKKKTPPIPDRVFSPLLAACLHIVEVVGADVASATDHLGVLNAIPHAGWGGVRPDFDSRLDDYLASLRADGRPVPTSSRFKEPSPSLQAIALHLGMRDGTALNVPDRMAKIQAAVEAVGLGVGGLYGARPGIEFDLDTLRTTRRVVHTACMIVVAALSGMRYSELAEIEPGAHRRVMMPSGAIRYRVESKLLKGEQPGGKRELWTVIEPVVAALIQAERLFPGRRPLQVYPFSVNYRDLCTWVHRNAEREGLEPVPTDWFLTPRQFRRTLARAIAWRPGGVIAGKIHLRHISVATTEGYAGSPGESASAFIAEIEAERRIVNRETAAKVVAAVERGEPVAGLGARELTKAVADLDSPTGRGAQVRNREDALEELIRKRADTLYVMPLAYCWFTNPDRARCLKNSPDKSKPLVGSCRPDLCGNATIHPEHAPTWISGLDALRATIADRRVPEGERQRLTAQADAISKLVDSIED